MCHSITSTMIVVPILHHDVIEWHIHEEIGAGGRVGGGPLRLYRPELHPPLNQSSLALH
jgi:hypothetical protein